MVDLGTPINERVWVTLKYPPAAAASAVCVEYVLAEDVSVGRTAAIILETELIVCQCVCVLVSNARCDCQGRLNGGRLLFTESIEKSQSR